MKRNLLIKLEEWLNKTSKNGLLILGVRQVGKTYLVREFASKHFDKNHFIEINCELNNIYDYQFL